MKRLLWLLPAGGLVLALALTAATFEAVLVHHWSALVEDPARPAADFGMSDEKGKPAHLSDMRGEWILLAFGYTTCPDVCPTTLAHLAAVRRQIGPDAARVGIVFVTIDPARDSSEVLARYVSKFDPAIKGFTGTDAEVARAADAYGVQYARIEAGSAAGYLMNHTAYVYVIDPQFRLRMRFPFGVYAEEMTDDLRYLMRFKEPGT